MKIINGFVDNFCDRSSLGRRRASLAVDIKAANNYVGHLLIQRNTVGYNHDIWIVFVVLEKVYVWRLYENDQDTSG